MGELLGILRPGYRLISGLDRYHVVLNWIREFVTLHFHRLNVFHARCRLSYVYCGGERSKLSWTFFFDDYLEWGVILWWSWLVQILGLLELNVVVGLIWTTFLLLVNEDGLKHWWLERSLLNFDRWFLFKIFFSFADHDCVRKDRLFRHLSCQEITVLLFGFAK